MSTTQGTLIKRMTMKITLPVWPTFFPHFAVPALGNKKQANIQGTICWTYVATHCCVFIGLFLFLCLFSCIIN